MSHTLFATHTGKLIDYRNIYYRDICLEDIAHHLTNIQRFGGCLPFNIRYSVASHSINCYRMATKLFPGEKEVHRTALMHDATEAYLGDVVSGLKTMIPQYKQIESNIWELIKKYYSLQDFTRVEEIDKRIVLDEAKALLPNNYSLYLRNQSYMPYNVFDIVPDVCPNSIKESFLQLCEELGIYD